MFSSLLSLILGFGLAGNLYDEPEARVVARGRQPQAALDSEGRVWLTYARDNAIWLRTSENGGKTFSGERKVAQAKAMDVGMRRGPRIVAVDGALLITCITGEQARGRDGDLFVWRSHDNGYTWSQPRQLNSAGGSAREGLQATAAAGKHVAVVWLDMRDKGTTLYGVFSEDGGETFTEDRLLYASPDGTICECCAPQAAVDEQGRIAVMFRNALSGNRDMYLMKSTDGGTTFSEARQQGEGHWLIHACPMDGGAMAIDGDEIEMIWRRGVELFVTSERFDEASDAPTAERRIGEGENPALTVVDGSSHAVFRRAGTVAYVAQRLEAKELARQGEDPIIVALAEPGSLLVLWEEDQQVIAKAVATGDRP